MKMRVGLFLGFILAGALSIAVYAADDILTVQSNRLTDLLPFWENMSQCNRYEKAYNSRWGTSYYKILGVENNSCHVIIPELPASNCYFPLAINKKIADSKVKSYKEKLYNIKNNQKYSYNTNNDIDNYMQTMSAKYCKY